MDGFYFVQTGPCEVSKVVATFPSPMSPLGPKGTIEVTLAAYDNEGRLFAVTRGMRLMMMKGGRLVSASLDRMVAVRARDGCIFIKEEPAGASVRWAASTLVAMTHGMVVKGPLLKRRPVEELVDRDCSGMKRGRIVELDLSSVV